MSFYDALKDAVNIAQKLDDVELYRQLIDLGAQALDLQEEIIRLREENAELKKAKDLEADIECYVDAFVLRKSDPQPIKYCAGCWVDKRKLASLQDDRYDNYICPLCKLRVIDMRNWNERRMQFKDEEVI